MKKLDIIRHKYSSAQIQKL